MDKNTIVGLALIVGILLFFNTINNNEDTKNQKVVDTVFVNNISDIPLSSNTNDKDALVETKNLETQYLENNVIKIEFTNQGGQLLSTQLKKFKTYDSSDLLLFKAGQSDFILKWIDKNQQTINSNNLIFSSEKINENTLYYTYNFSENAYLQLQYTLKDAYDLQSKIIISEELAKNIANKDEVALLWKMTTPSQEAEIATQQNNSTVYVLAQDGDYDYIDEMKDKKEIPEKPIKWVAFKQQFFSSILIANNFSFGSKNSFFASHKIENNDNLVKSFEAQFHIPVDVTQNNYDLTYYLGPNQYTTLKNYDLNLEKILPLGWGIFRWVNVFLIIPIFDLLNSWITSMGLVILLLTIAIKLILSPITYKMYISSAKMRALKPEIQALNEKHKNDDPLKKQQATMQLYKQTGVNPFAGCIPMLIQFPILIAAFRFFPAAFEMRQASFLWANDLSMYDSIYNLPFNIPFYGDHISLFTILMSISLVLFTRMNAGQMDMGGGSPEMALQMKIMNYVMPVMMFFFFNSYAAGLTYYYFVANITSVLQQMAIKKWLVDESQLHAKIQENKSKPLPKKRSRFQEAMEQMMKQQAESKKNKV